MMNIDKIPVEYRPLSVWAYIGYFWLFNIPVIGLIFLIIYSISNSNINRRNFARSFLVVYLFLICVLVVFGLLGGFADIINMFK